MRAVLVTVIAIAALCVFAAANALADNPSGTGQPSQTCLSSTAPNEPGNAANAPGSAFNEPSATNPNGGTAGQVYAGNGRNTQTPANGHAVSQYDVACFQVSQHH
jgi:hypothetical protein